MTVPDSVEATSRAEVAAVPPQFRRHHASAPAILTNDTHTLCFQPTFSMYVALVTQYQLVGRR